MLFEYRGKVKRVVDGDTLDMDWIDLGFGIRIGEAGTPLRVRLAHADAYETSLRGETTPEEKALGLKAKAWLRTQVEGKVVRLRTERDSRGSFGRWLAWVWLDGGDDHPMDAGESLNVQLIELGYAVPYEG